MCVCVCVYLIMKIWMSRCDEEESIKQQRRMEHPSKGAKDWTRLALFLVESLFQAPHAFRPLSLPAHEHTRAREENGY